MQALPCVRVRDLPPSASFYSAITQPLGLRFVSANAGSIVFGNPNPTFEVKATPAGTAAPKPTRIVLSASSPSAVSAFHAAARRANPNGNCHILLKEDDGAGGESRASATDLEGNVMEIVYTPPNYSPGYAGSTVRQTQSTTTRHPTGILGWNLDAATSMVGAARSAVGSATPSRPGLATLVPPGEDESYRIICRSFTSSTVETSSPQEESSKGMSSGAVVGTVLGAAAAAAVGAGLAYAFMKKDRDRAPRQEFDAAPPFQRRATYHPGQQPRYVEMERTVEKVRYPEQYSPESNNYAQPAYTTRRSQVPSPPVEEIIDDPVIREDPPPRTRERSVGPPEKTLMITETEHKSTVGSEHPVPPPPPPPPMVKIDEPNDKIEPKLPNPKSQLHAELFKRTNPSPSLSQAPSKAPSKARSRAPDDDDDTRSHASSRSRHHHHRHHRHHHDREREREKDRDSNRDRDRDRDDDRRSHASSRHRRSRDTEAETYVSARSGKSSASTVRPTDKPPRSKAPSRAPSYVSAREIPSPPKEADWEDLVDDDKASVAPSDSISCVGEERPKPHARDIPFLQTRERIIIQ
ncbi:hypothetical protein F5Y10DRAFT_263440 [Nemania abortiva]|nr:hypothetical protein F5Y10DRAFT_263440 [Nemania abortiva]